MKLLLGLVAMTIITVIGSVDNIYANHDVPNYDRFGSNYDEIIVRTPTFDKDVCFFDMNNNPIKEYYMEQSNRIRIYDYSSPDWERINPKPGMLFPPEYAMQNFTNVTVLNYTVNSYSYITNGTNLLVPTINFYVHDGSKLFAKTATTLGDGNVFNEHGHSHGYYIGNYIERYNSPFFVIKIVYSLECKNDLVIFPINTPKPKTELQIANDNIETLETQLNHTNDKLDTKTDVKNKWKERYNTCYDKKENIKTELNQCNDTRDDLRTRLSNLEAQHNNTKYELSELQSTYNTTKSDYDELWIDYERSADMYYELSNKHDNLETELNQCKLDIVDKDNEYTQLLNDHETQITNLESKYNLLLQNNTDFQFTIDKLKQEKADLIKQVEELETDNQDLQNRIKELES